MFPARTTLKYLHWTWHFIASPLPRVWGVCRDQGGVLPYTKPPLPIPTLLWKPEMFLGLAHFSSPTCAPKNELCCCVSLDQLEVTKGWLFWRRNMDWGGYCSMWLRLFVVNDGGRYGIEGEWARVWGFHLYFCQESRNIPCRERAEAG